MVEKFLQAFLDTLYMVSLASVFALAAGLPLALLLVTTVRGGILEAPLVHRFLALLVNIFRATPFIIVLILVLPFTRAIVGTTIGVNAALVPLAICLIPYFARIAEVSLREVDAGLIEAAQAAGCNNWQIVRHVMVPEALPSLIGAFTVTVVATINASAMAGAVGAGGLGDLAIRYGYQRYNPPIVLAVVCVLLLIVTLVQLAGDYYARRLRRNTKEFA